MKQNVFPLAHDTPPPLLCTSLRPVFTAHENPWFKVVSRGGYYGIEYDTPQVVVLPVLNRDTIIMVRVNRPLIDDTPLELPAGGADPGETPQAAALREFSEETGIVINDPSRFMPILPLSEMPGRMPVLLSIFRVDISQDEFNGRRPSDDEIISVEAIPFEAAAAMIVKGEIYLSSPVAIISRLLLEFNAPFICKKKDPS